MWLSSEERAILGGEAGPAAAVAMRVLVALGEAAGAQRMVAIESAHIDSCLYHGRAGLDFAERLVAGGGRVRVPTTLNVASLDTRQPELVRLEGREREEAARLMDAYVALGGEPAWTCAPYQLPGRPGFGAQVAWGESNAIAFANSVLGARTERYGDFSDICAALAGRVPLAGLHTAEARRARMIFELPDLPAEAYEQAELYALVGHLVGQRSGSAVPAIVGLPVGSEDQLKALGAAAASSGAVALFHVVGVTPEAPTLADAAGGGRPPTTRLSMADLRTGWDELSTAANGARLDAVSLGTPHMSLIELERLVPRLLSLSIADGVTVYVSTARQLAEELERRGLLEAFRRPGVQLVVDTCTYITPILHPRAATVMTNSAKWAWYAPGNLGVDVCFGSLDDCLASAEQGRVIRERPGWLVG
ncbi:MAG TPA: aconitase X catalytic domain-containing protein [Candidatus Limnocylindrales bacterium]|nr:aconitase X catalytic domain-containing protein [Candidatus Limnocylindrales bacterium]